MADLPPARPGSENGGNGGPEDRDADLNNRNAPSETGSESGGGGGGPYARSAGLYLASGWNPLPVMGKHVNLPAGYTGETGKSVSASDVALWVATRGADNVGLRLPVGTVGIDVDDYGGKGGLATLRELSRRLGPLPATWSSTSRGDGWSRQLLYRTPVAELVRLPGQLGPGVEVIQHHHRYTVAWPSVHPETGAVYRWYSPDAVLAPDGVVPRIEDLEWLPEAWRNAGQLAGGGGLTGGGWTNPDVDRLLQEGVPAGAVQDDVLRDLVWRLVLAGASDAQVELQWLAVVARTPLTRVDEPWTVEDFRRHLRGARAKLGAGGQMVPVGAVEREWASEQAAVVGSGVGAPAKAGGAVVRGEGAGADGGLGAAADGGVGGDPPGLGAPPSVGGGGGDPFPGPQSPLEVARRLQLEPPWRVTGAPTRWHWRGAWLRWTGTHWAEEEAGVAEDLLYHRLERETWLKLAKSGLVVATPWNPVKKSVAEVDRALQAVQRLSGEVEAGSLWDVKQKRWLEPDEVAGQVACRNGAVDPVTRVLSPHSPRWLNLSALPFDYDPQAVCPRWRRFLEEVLPGDSDAQGLLQEWFGYVVSGRSSLQKLMFLVGASRSGKSTTAGVLTKLVGAGNVAAPTLSSFAAHFGLASLIGKPLAVVDDARYSKSIDMQVVIERLLSITGGGRLDVDRKNRPVWTGRLPTRIVISSNELPWFRDASGAIVNRMLVVEFRESFLGREDPLLERALEAELPGILNWALEGLERLRQSGGVFTTPASALEAITELSEQASPVKTFIAEECVLHPDAKVGSEELFLAWSVWKGGVKQDRSARTTFGIQLRAAVPGLKKIRLEKQEDGTRPWGLGGIGLKHGLPAWAGGAGND